jgi:sensor histidine kinase regulating citrate/malate metabolism
MIALFGIIATTTSLVSGWTLYSQLTAEYQSKGAAIAESIADSSVEVLLNRDAATLQAFVDQFTEIEGVSYVFVEDRSGEILSHTFVPRVPQEVTLLVNAKTRGESALHTTFEGQRDRGYSPRDTHAHDVEDCPL